MTLISFGEKSLIPGIEIVSRNVNVSELLLIFSSILSVLLIVSRKSRLFMILHFNFKAILRPLFLPFEPFYKANRKLSDYGLTNIRCETDGNLIFRLHAPSTFIIFIGQVLGLNPDTKF